MSLVQSTVSGRQFLVLVAQEAQGSALPVFARLGVGIIIVGAVEGSYRLGDVMTWVGDGECVGMTATAGKAAASITRPRCGLAKSWQYVSVELGLHEDLYPK